MFVEIDVDRFLALKSTFNSDLAVLKLDVYTSKKQT